MRIIVITPDWELENETGIVSALFEEGLWRLHLRKPQYTRDDLKEYLKKIPSRYHHKIVIHSIRNKSLINTFGLKGFHINSDERRGPTIDALKGGFLKLLNPSISISTTFRTQRNLKKASQFYDYVILNNIFKSRSDKTFKKHHDWTKLENTMNEISHRVFARGGVTSRKIQEVRNLGFSGATIMNEIWKSEDPVSQFLEIKEKAKQYPSFFKQNSF